VNKEKIKPTKKWYKQRLNIVGIVFIATLVILIVYILVISTHVSIHSAEDAYNTTNNEIQAAVKDYQTKHNELSPIINTSDRNIINVCVLLISMGGSLRLTPNGLWSSNGSNDDNCDGGCEGCFNTSHYVWAVDDQGNVYSTCIGEDCEANGEDGYQGVFP
jgi:Na+-transporting methylmalonyl-CoA/oxaloacetate decarboxylase gamma subunit